MNPRTCIPAASSSDQRGGRAWMRRPFQLRGQEYHMDKVIGCRWLRDGDERSSRRWGRLRRNSKFGPAVNVLSRVTIGPITCLDASFLARRQHWQVALLLINEQSRHHWKLPLSISCSTSKRWFSLASRRSGLVLACQRLRPGPQTSTCSIDGWLLIHARRSDSMEFCSHEFVAAMEIASTFANEWTCIVGLFIVICLNLYSYGGCFRVLM